MIRKRVVAREIGSCFVFLALIAWQQRWKKKLITDVGCKTYSVNWAKSQSNQQQTAEWIRRGEGSAGRHWNLLDLNNTNWHIITNCRALWGHLELRYLFFSPTSWRSKTEPKELPMANWWTMPFTVKNECFEINSCAHTLSLSFVSLAPSIQLGALCNSWIRPSSIGVINQIRDLISLRRVYPSLFRYIFRWNIRSVW